MRNQKGNVGIVFGAYLVLILLLGVGWVFNLLAIVHADFGQVTGLLIVRCFGVFIVPLGSILGYFVG